MTNPRLSIATLLLLAVWGCQDEAPSPTGPASAPSSAVAAAEPLSFLEVSAGIEHACGVAADGTAWCWGANEFGELGIPPEDSPFPCSSRPCSLRPLAVAGGLRFRHVSAGNHFTCGLTTGDEVFCWGDNSAGQLGSGSTAASSSTPTEIAGDRKFLEVSAGLGNMACAINLVQSAFCWGAGRLGNGGTSSRSPVKVSGNLAWRQLAAGSGYGCGITTINEAWCWGVNNRGQLGNGTTTGTFTPVPSAQGLTLAQIAAGGATTCAVLTDARAFCWGDAMATGAARNRGRTLTPTAVVGTRKWSNIAVGSLHGCGVTLGGRGLCWGSGGLFGALGNGGTVDRFTPQRVLGEIDLVSISAGFVFSCGVAVDGKAWCWGDDSNGQLGDGSVEQRLEPVAVAAP
jgi:alpha-tubulin suppressor-like RCC1 family protein